MGALLDSFEWRHIGPYRGGRVVAVSGDPVDDHVFWFGSTGGGVWRTKDAGSYWENVSDGQFGRASVGALEVAPSDRNVIWAGMGEACIRSTVSHGDGVYRSTDGGLTWRHAGLADTRHIGKLRVHPTDPDTAYVAALGHMSGPSAERGLYRTRDGGKRWTRVLSRGTRAGAIDVSIDRSNPRVLYAATWEAVRLPWVVSSGGPGSGLFRSTDGGDTWTDISRSPGFPRGVLGRIGVVASARPGRVYAIVEAPEGGVYRSDDHGASWTRGSADRSLWYRGYYYEHIVADPVNGDTVWVLNQDCWRSTDGGSTFHRVSTPHGDNHDLWIDPRDTRRMVVGCDMGAAVTFNGGSSWSSLYNQPTAELYHVTTDSRTPYRVYAAQQDCGTVSLPSRSMLAAITNAEALDVGGGESGYVAVRPDDPDIVYSGQFNGYLTRFDARTGQARSIEVWPEAQGWGTGASLVKHRFTWSHPVVLSPHDPGVLYTAGERVFRSTDEGTTWTVISPDLTRNDTSKMEPSGGPITADRPATERERVGTIFTFAESPVRRGVLWAGSDDGRVHLSRDDGGSWTDVTPRQMRPWTLVSTVEPSPHDPDAAYVAATRYLLDDFRPMLFRTRDRGRTWTAIDRGIASDDFTRVIRADPVRRGLLFAGTETGVYVSFNDGARWHRWRSDRPVVPVHDLTLKDNDLLAATHGRGFWAVDDISALRQAFPPPMGGPTLFEPGPVMRFQGGGRWRKPPVPGHNYSMEGFGSIAWEPLVRPGLRAERYFDAARNPPDGAVVRYHLPRAARGPVVLSFHDARGRELARFASDMHDEPKPPASAGMHRFVWDLRLPGPAALEGGTGDRRLDRPQPGPFVAPGRYTVRLAADGVTRSASFEVAADPRTGATQRDLEDQLALLLRLRDATSEAHSTASEARRALQRIDAVVGLAGPKARADRTRDAVRARIAKVEAAIVPPRSKSTSDAFISPPTLAAKLIGLSSKVASADAAPTKASLALATELIAAVADVRARLRKDLAAVPAIEAKYLGRSRAARSKKG